MRSLIVSTCLYVVSIFLISVSSQSTGMPTSAPVILQTSSPSLVRVTENDTVKLECHASPPESLEINWRSSGGLINYHGEVLTLENVEREAMLADYICTASNSVGDTRHRVQLDVQFPPDVYAKKSEIYEVLDYPVYFHCFVLAFPWPKVSWTKDGVAVKNDTYLTVTESTTGRYYTTVVINISKLQDAHVGVYECKAENDLGSGKSQTVVNKVDKRECPPVCPDKPIILNSTAQGR